MLAGLEFASPSEQFRATKELLERCFRDRALCVWEAPCEPRRSSQEALRGACAALLGRSPLRVLLSLAGGELLQLSLGADGRGVQAMELVRLAFRRPLELWLTSDLGLYLEESGYEVEMRALCRREVTPRNIMLLGRRAKA